MYRIALTLFTLIAGWPAWAQEQRPLKFGLSLSLSGDFAFFGEEVKRGALLAQEEIKERTGEAPELLFEDDKCLPKNAVTAYKKLTEIEHADLVIGPGCTGGIVAVAPLVMQHEGRYLLALLDANEEVARSGSRVYALGFSSEEVAHKAAEEMIKRGLKRSALLYETDAWAELVRNAFRKRFEALGGAIIAEEQQRVDDKDYRPALLRLSNSRPQALYYDPAYSAGAVLKQLRQLQLRFPVFGPDTFGVQDVIDVAGEAAEGAVFAFPLVEETEPGAAGFLKRFKQKYAEEPKSLLYAALGYDSVRIAHKALRSGSDFPTVMKNISYTGGVIDVPAFDENRQSKIAAQLMTISAGTFVKLAKSE